MSLILEALKKSEQQRQREKAPSLQSIHQSPVAAPVKKNTQAWWLFAAAIVICNVAFFGYWFWRQQNVISPVVQTPSAPASSAHTSSKEAPSATSSQTTSSELVNSNVTQPSAVTRDVDTRESQPEFSQISPRGVPAQSMPVDSQRVEEINELPDSVRNNLPAMTFSFHVYSENPAQRTIIINDRRMREGEEISSGLRLQLITQDGVILQFEQHRIHISVLTGW